MEANGGGYVGFANLPKQFNRRMVKKGFDFTLMLVGESGLGKSTLVSSLFNIDKEYNQKKLNHTQSHLDVHQTVEIEKTEVNIEESGIKLKLTIVDTPGFGESLAGVDQQGPISHHIDCQFQKYLDDETGINRRNITDTRIHCCFYFISPHSNGLRPMDVEFMKQLHHKVNIVPLIAKADTLTPQEIAMKKAKILEDIQREQVRIYQLPDADDEDNDPGYKNQLNLLKSSIPFAVVGSNELHNVNGKQVRGREYPWGVVDIDNPRHSEFSLLKTMLISHMQDLQEVTHDLHYENFRAQVLSNSSNLNGSGMMGQSTSSIGRYADSESLEAKELEIQKMREMMEHMQRQLVMQQQVQGNSMEQMGNGHLPGLTNGSTPQKHRPPPPPRRIDGSSNGYSRTNLDV